MMRKRRPLCDTLCRAIAAILPRDRRDWAIAIRAEADAIPRDADALLFMIHALIGLLPRAIMAQLSRRIAAPIAPLSTGTTGMTPIRMIAANPQRTGIFCALTATALGIAYLLMANAPAPLMAMNLAALLLGLGGLTLLNRLAPIAAERSVQAALFIALLLLVTSLFGNSAGGASRWIALGPLTIQPSLILLPLMILFFVQARTMVSALAMTIGALALALQPDRAMAAVLLAGLATLALLRPGKAAFIALAASALAFAMAMARPDTQPAMPWVDQILYSAFAVHWLAGLAVVGGSMLLLVPGVAALFLHDDRRDMCLVFGAIWLTTIAAAAIGNYPTPVVGYSGSAVLGYVLSLAALPRKRLAMAGSGVAVNGETGIIDDDGSRLLNAVAA